MTSHPHEGEPEPLPISPHVPAIDDPWWGNGRTEGPSEPSQARGVLGALLVIVGLVGAVVALGMDVYPKEADVVLAEITGERHGPTSADLLNRRLTYTVLSCAAFLAGVGALVSRRPPTLAPANTTPHTQDREAAQVRPLVLGENAVSCSACHRPVLIDDAKWFLGKYWCPDDFARKIG